MAKKGFFVVLEGIDGSGTSTQARALTDNVLCLSSYNSVLTTHEPWKSEEIQRKLKEDRSAYSDGWSMAKLYTNDRKRHQEELIL